MGRLTAARFIFCLPIPEQCPSGGGAVHGRSGHAAETPLQPGLTPSRHRPVWNPAAQHVQVWYRPLRCM